MGPERADPPAALRILTCRFLAALLLIPAQQVPVVIVAVTGIGVPTVLQHPAPGFVAGAPVVPALLHHAALRGKEQTAMVMLMTRNAAIAMIAILEFFLATLIYFVIATQVTQLLLPHQPEFLNLLGV